MGLGGGVATAVDDALRRSIAAGITYGLAAGNDYGANDCSSSPARTPEAITVGSTTNTDVRSGFSNIGTCLDIFAPGSGITSAWIGGDSGSNTINGTSMATPHVVGAVALYLADHPSAAPQQVRDASVSGGTQGTVGNAGSGSPNVLLYTGSETATPPTCPAVTSSGTVAIPVADCAGTTSATTSVETANGAFSLRVRDLNRYDNGSLNGRTLTV